MLPESTQSMATIDVEPDGWPTTRYVTAPAIMAAPKHNARVPIVSLLFALNLVENQQHR
jgi:hypothetical protein